MYLAKPVQNLENYCVKISSSVINYKGINLYLIKKEYICIKLQRNANCHILITKLDFDKLTHEIA